MLFLHIGDTEASILDVGCGTGKVLKEVRRMHNNALLNLLTKTMIFVLYIIKYTYVGR